MIEIEHSAEYAQGPRAVFRTLTDFAALPAWQHDVLESRLEGTEPALGASIHQVRKVMGRRTEVELSIVEFEPDGALTLQTPESVKPSVRQTFRLQARPEGTKVEFRLVLDGVPKMAEHLARAQLGKTVPAMFDRLDAVLAAAMA